MVVVVVVDGGWVVVVGGIVVLVVDVVVVVLVVVVLVVVVVVVPATHWLLTQLLPGSHDPHSSGVPQPSSSSPHWAFSAAHEVGAQHTPNLSSGLRRVQTLLWQLL